MSKSVKDSNKISKSKSKEVKSELNKPEINEQKDNVVIVQETVKDEIILSDLKKRQLSDLKKGQLSDLSLSDLFFLEKMCSLLCKRYETSARIDKFNNDKFKEYNVYYEKIFSEIERRVLESFKN